MRSASFHFAMRSPRANEPTLSWPRPSRRRGGRSSCPRSRPSEPRRCRHSPPTRRAPRLERLGERAALVGLDQHRVAGAARRGLAHEPRVGDEKVVADDLHALAGGAREADEAVGIVLGERVLDRDDRVASSQPSSISIRPSASSSRASRPRRVAAGAAEVGGGDVERDRDLAPGAKPARSIACTSVASASSLVAKSGHQPPSSATPACEPRSPSGRRRGDRPRRSTRAPGESRARPGRRS